MLSPHLSSEYNVYGIHFLRLLSSIDWGQSFLLFLPALLIWDQREIGRGRGEGGAASRPYYCPPLTPSCLAAAQAEPLVKSLPVLQRAPFLLANHRLRSKALAGAHRSNVPGRHRQAAARSGCRPPRCLAALLLPGSLSAAGLSWRAAAAVAR